MIRKSSLAFLKVMDFFQVLKDITAHVAKYDIAQPKLAARAEALQQAVEELDVALKPLRASAATEKLLSLDQQRDEALIGFAGQVRSFRKHPKTDIREAARQLQLTLDKYGKSPQELPFREETAMISQFLQDMEQPENAAALEKIFADTWLQEMTRANTEYDALYNSRTQEGAKVEVGAVRAARIKAQKAFEALARGLNSFADLNDSEEYKPLEDEINQEVKQAKSSQRTGESSRAGEKAEDKTPLD